MRYVDTSRFAAPEPWLAKAARETAKVRAAVEAHQAPKFPSLWTDPQIRDPLIDIVGQKCWYCETTVHSSNPDVDHFRPKGGRNAVGGQLGYWWLAYDPTNYRIACKYCNSGGGKLEDGSRPAAKVAQFPLLVEADRATGPDDDHHREKPILLDPAVKSDHFLIDFSADGKARRRSMIPLTFLEETLGLCRVMLSIDILQLDRLLLQEDRKKVMKDIAEMAELIAVTGGQQAVLAFVEKRVRCMIDPRHEYSGAALSALRSRRDNAVIEELFAADLEADLPETAPEVGLPPIIDLAYLLISGIIEPGAELAGHTSSGKVAATVLAGGRVQFGARTYPSPDSAARAATGTAGVDGWTFWHAEQEGHLPSLAELRDRAAS